MEEPEIIILYVFAYWDGSACGKMQKTSENIDETLVSIILY